MPLLTRMPKQKVKAQVVSLAPAFAPAAVLRQHGIPVHEVALSKRRFAFGAFKELLNTTRQFRPDVIQAWGHTAQLAALMMRSRCDWKPKVVWSVADTLPIAKDGGFIDRRKLLWTGKKSAKVDRIVYASEAAASMHRRHGYPEGDALIIPPGVDPTRFKPDFAARQKVRDQLGLGSDAFVIGMAAPFQSEYDHSTLLKGVGELIKTNPHIHVILAGHGVQKGNAPLMALVGGGTLGTRTQLLGEWSDISSFFAACDVACSSALTDSARMTLVMAMLCGVPCVATGMGAQGEVLGQFGVAIEPGSPVAFQRGITRLMDMPAERRAFMVQGARKHALNNFVSVRSMQKYLQLYYDVVGRQALAATDVPAPEIDAAVPVAPPDTQTTREKAKAKAAALVSLHEMSDPDSLEEQVPEIKIAFKAPPKIETRPLVHDPRPATEGDVLQIFESAIKRESTDESSPASNRARGVAEDLGDLLTPEELASTEVKKPVQVVEPPRAKPVVEVAAPEAAKPVKVAVKLAESPKVDAPVQLVQLKIEPALKTAAPLGERPVVQPEPPASAVKAASLILTDAPAPPRAELKIATRNDTPVVRATPVQLPMLPQDEPAVNYEETGIQLTLLPDLEDSPVAASA